MRVQHVVQSAKIVVGVVLLLIKIAKHIYVRKGKPSCLNNNSVLFSLVLPIFLTDIYFLLQVHPLCDAEIYLYPISF